MGNLSLLGDWECPHTPGDHQHPGLGQPSTLAGLKTLPSPPHKLWPQNVSDEHEPPQVQSPMGKLNHHSAYLHICLGQEDEENRQ